MSPTRVFRIARPAPAFIWWGGALALGLLATARRTAAQELVGRLQSATDDSPISGALLLLVDSMGREVIRTLSSPTGRFDLSAAAPGSYRVRVLRIGFLSWSSPVVQLARGERREFQLKVEERIVRLPDIEVAGSSRCGARPGNTDVLASLLAEAEKALAITEQTIREGNHRFRTETYTTRPTERGTPGERIVQRSLGPARWPVLSAPPESLAVWGFVHVPRGEWWLSEMNRGEGPVYFGPDARVLFSTWFLDSHCFSVLPSTDTAGLIIVEFGPVTSQTRPDIRGRLRLHPETLELRSLEFSYTRLPRWVPPGSAGGDINFRRLNTGAWVIDRWSLRAPIPLTGPGGSPTTLFGFAETGGRVTEIYDRRQGARS